jgi:hypothetical protein
MQKLKCAIHVLFKHCVRRKKKENKFIFNVKPNLVFESSVKLLCHINE